MRQIVSKPVGIDLGTTNSVVAVMDPTDRDVRLHRDHMRSPTTASCVWRRDASSEIVVGHRARARVGSTPRPVRSIKRMMGQATTVPLAGEELTPAEVSAYILAEMKRQIEQDMATFETPSTAWIVDRAIVTVPAYFDQPQMDATHQAARDAGLEIVDLLQEPTAAACDYCWRTNTTDGTFLVYDLGGGTFDVSIVRATDGVYQVLGISGNNRLGGDDIDAALATHLKDLLVQQGNALELDPGNDPEDQLRFDKLKFLAEGLKKQLSSQDELLVSDAVTLTDKRGDPVDFNLMLSRHDLEELARPMLELTIGYCDEAIERATRKAGVTLGDVDQVILAGGSTHMPLVRELVRRELCAPPSADNDRRMRAKCDEPVYEEVDTTVARGAAIRAAALGGVVMYDPERTMRVAWRGSASTDRKTVNVAGTVESLTGGPDLDGGQVSLRTVGDTDDADLGADGSFAFAGVPLQPEAANDLVLEVVSATGDVLMEFTRSVVQGARGEIPPVGSQFRSGVLSKALRLEVLRDGRLEKTDLIPDAASLPAIERYSFSHPGDTETVLFNFYQRSSKIQEVRVEVPSSLPRGTRIDLDVHVDERYHVAVNGSIGDTVFDAMVTIPPPREMPTAAETDALERAFRDVVEHLPRGRRHVAEAKWKALRNMLDAAMAQGDQPQAVHLLEQLEELVEEHSDVAAPLEPPKETFDTLVAECREMNDYLRDPGTRERSERPHDPEETARNIDAQAEEGDRAFRAGNQRAYADAHRMLQSFHGYLQDLLRKDTPTATPTERALALLMLAAKEVEQVADTAAAAGRADFQDEVRTIERSLTELRGMAARDPERVISSAALHRDRLSKMAAVMQSRDAPEINVPLDDRPRASQ